MRASPSRTRWHNRYAERWRVPTRSVRTHTRSHAFEVVRPRHSQNFGQLARDLAAEAGNLETVGHDDSAVYASQIGDPVATGL
jgi:hypothetical protein